MRLLLTTNICICLIAGFITGCIAIPVPLLPGDGIYKVEADIEQLVESKATKIEVIEKLGKPRKYRTKSISYGACRESGGVGLLLIAAGGLGGDFAEYKGDDVCVELLLNFDGADRLSGYQETSWTNNYYRSDERLILARLANQGDLVAAWLLYLARNQKPEDVDLLCQAADGGIIKAQNLLGKLYSSGKKGVPQDFKKAYLWYKIAATDTVLDDEFYDNSIRESSRTDLILLKNSMTADEIVEAENLYPNWEPGQCQRDLSDASSKINLND